MIKVLMVAWTKPPHRVLRDTVREMHAHGAEVEMCGLFDVRTTMKTIGLDKRHGLRARAEAYGPEFRRSARLMSIPEQIWKHAELDPWVQLHAAGADVLVALDNAAVYTVWELARRNPDADAVFGLLPALRAVERREAETPRPAPRPVKPVARSTRHRATLVAKRAMDKALSPAVLRTKPGARLVRAATNAPGLPERVRTRLASQASIGLFRAGRQRGAHMVTESAMQRISSPRRRANVLGNVANLELAQGRQPTGLVEAYQAELDHADSLYEQGRLRPAVASFLEAMHLAFHRVVHLDGLSSPLAADPETFTAPIHRSTIAQAVSSPKGRAAPAATPPNDRPLRVLLATRTNDNFLGELRDHLGAHPAYEMQFVDLANAPELSRYTRNHVDLVEHLISGDEELAAAVEKHLRPLLDWADTVFVDWCTALAVLFTAIDPGTTRLMVRLHSYEAFTMWPQLMDFSRVDDFIFVSEHVRDLVTSAVPRLQEEQAPRLHVLHNAMTLERFDQPKVEDARLNLGLVGYSVMAKDPRWAIEVLRLVRAVDDRYRLFLIGGGFQEDHTAGSRHYGKLLRADYAEFAGTGAIVRPGKTKDVPGALTNVGVILTTSVREGSPSALIEGAASGAVPVVRDWPFYAGKKNSARNLYPDDWVVTTPQEAADRILATTAQEQLWQGLGREAAEFARSGWDLSVVDKELDRLFLGEHGRS